jgi:choloylglycine hydrolase
MWPQWVVDQFTTVAEAVAGLAAVRVVPAMVHGTEMPLHLALEDPSDDSAIVEMLDGTPRIHHGREHRVMANDPSYEEQLASLARYRDFGGDLPMPGDIVSADRFVRASYFLRHLPPPATREEALAGVMSLGRNVSIPFGAPDFFQSTRTPNVVWIELDSLALEEGAPVVAVDPLDVTLVGNVAGRMEGAELGFGV